MSVVIIIYCIDMEIRNVHNMSKRIELLQLHVPSSAGPSPFFLIHLQSMKIFEKTRKQDKFRSLM